MPTTEIIIYQESPDDIPLLDWLMALPAGAKDYCDDAMSRLYDFWSRFTATNSGLFRRWNI
ncbi:MAG: hypothetical protein LBU65_01335 [Planctomycetaceae bacterium]|nr:hypothetical protein [Planctomycetaceae bacterium]